MKKYYFILTNLFFCITIIAQNINVPYLEINTDLQNEFEKSYRIAIGDIVSNISMYKGGLLEEDTPCLLAGIDYGKPWTRDASINVWNGFGLISADVAKSTLLAQLIMEKDELLITGQYWDSVIWIIGAWQYYLFTGDKEFLKLAYTAGKNTITLKEAEEFDTEIKLFRGPAVYGDGVSAYPKKYTEASDTKNSETFSGIENWVEFNLDEKAEAGFGIPMFALSTNTVYYKSYDLLNEMSVELGYLNTQWSSKANKIRETINAKFWNPSKGIYNYLIDPFGGSEKQESLGNIFTILFDIANDEQKELIFDNIIITDHGIPCVYPSFVRYKKSNNYGRHSGTVWSHIQGFWAQICSQYNKNSFFMNEYTGLTDKSFRDKQFVEIYHPDSGEQYGGLQEPTLDSTKVWDSTNIQTWSATAYFRMILYGLLGLEFDPNGIRINPNVPIEFKGISFKNLHYRKMILNIDVKGNGSNIESIKINNEDISRNFIDSHLVGKKNIEIVLTKNSDKNEKN